MKIFAPTYYKSFKCIADKCQHSCCIGWEIDIDKDTLDIYKRHEGVLKKSFEEKISCDDTPHFILDDGERCPFLNEKNLCDIYAELGEECLCQICTDHPRFRNFYSDRIEIGLGICCEEACRIILNDNSPFVLEVIEDDGGYGEISSDESSFFNIRKQIFEIISDDFVSFDDCFDKIFNTMNMKLPCIDYASLFDGLEYMEKSVSDMVSNTCHISISESHKKRLALYFLYRHLADSLDDGMLAERVVFAYISVKAIEMMCSSESFDVLAECSRIYSSEIEYSVENIDEILYRIGDLIEILV